MIYKPSIYKERGFLTFVEGIYRNQSSKLTAKTRYILFDTDSYDSRVYQYESDVEGNFSNPPLYGKGTRWYIFIGYDVFQKIRVSAKYSETKKLNTLVIGSGNDEISGNFDNQIALQMDLEL